MFRGIIRFDVLLGDRFTNLTDELFYTKYWIKITRFCNIFVQYRL